MLLSDDFNLNLVIDAIQAGMPQAQVSYNLELAEEDGEEDGFYTVNIADPNRGIDFAIILEMLHDYSQDHVTEPDKVLTQTDNSNCDRYLDKDDLSKLGQVELLQLFAQYNFEDGLGHSLLSCQPFLDLVEGFVKLRDGGKNLNNSR